MEAACDFSALHCPSTNPPPPSAEKTVVKGWAIERDIVEDNTHPCFDHGSASYTVPADGLYKIVVELIPLGGPAIFNDNNQRQIVPYSLCLQEPPNELDDQIIRRYHDIGNKLAKVEHIKAGTTISCIRMPNVPGDECIRFKVEIILRKRKRDKREPTRKEKKNRKRMLRRQTMAHHLTTLSSHGSGDASRLHDYYPHPQHLGGTSDSDSEWEKGFESDSTSDDLPSSRLAKPLMISRPAGLDDLNRSEVFFDINDEVVP
ncbi:hypothetical protein BWQ96_10711 [Gracilariopsis chorda]|uniref:Uncharacterized protein n=1 Tax=Gracilariopsis chorda TaxID=448386 RepID=A0A2V3IBV6_9FLOR|nr:hypothetical protein BWQ96_10711 [Gracilariopsis chorda]|eukprot:PXF39592.1 hypothetical protein BWQ96_10711 [Gracilariopsis chorda]